MHSKKLVIDKYKPAIIIAELSANHNGSLDLAIETIKAAKRAGADCIKLQTYTAETITIDCANDDFIIKDTIWNGKKLFELYKEAYTPWEWHKVLFETAESEGLLCFSSPFDKSAVDFLEQFDPPAYKIASFEITDIPLIEYVASKSKPVIISTGISNEEDIKLAIEACHKMGNYEITLLKCTSSYPAPLEEANLIMINDFSSKYNITVGLSDHTMGYISPLISIAFGAKIIEKHFIIDRKLGGPDSSFSMDEKEFTEMVHMIRQAEKAIGIVDYNLTERQIKGREFSRSLYVVENIGEGDVITEKNVKSIRPGFGLHPKFYSQILGKKSVKKLVKGERFSMEMIEK